jgi:hypothetical protein
MTQEQRQTAEESLVNHWCKEVDTKELMQLYYSDRMDYLSGLQDYELVEMLDEIEL